MNQITERFARFPFLIPDGALATELERKGADLKDDLWSAKILFEQPALIEAVHLEYLEAYTHACETCIT